jgi:ribosomal protein S1
LYKAESLLIALKLEEVTPGVAELLNEVLQRKQAPQWREVDAWLQSSKVVAAPISSVSKHGVSVELPGGMYAVLQTGAATRYQRGQSVDVRVICVETLRDRVTVREAVVPAALPSVGSIAVGRITGHQPYGVFVRVGNAPGLIYATELPIDNVAWPRWLPLESEWPVKILRYTDKGFNAALVEPPWKMA